MAVLCSSSLLRTEPFSSSLKKPPFLGFSNIVSSKPSISVLKANRTTRISCQDKTVSVPVDQRWMFEDTGFNGPAQVGEQYPFIAICYPISPGQETNIYNDPKKNDLICNIRTRNYLHRMEQQNELSTLNVQFKDNGLACMKPSGVENQNSKGYIAPDVWNKTWYPKAADHVNTDKPWYVVDASDKILGRLASTIAIYIRGKNLATFTPSVDMGAFVIVVNAEKVAVSGKKRTQKLYRRHSGRPGGMKVETFDQLQNRIPERIIEHAVRGMLPKGRLGRALFNHLKVYTGPTHPHEAQRPVDLPIRDKRITKQN